MTARELTGQVEHLDQLTPALRTVFERRDRPELRLDLETAGAHEPAERRAVRRFGPGLVGGDRRVGGAGATSQLADREPGAVPGISKEDSR